MPVQISPELAKLAERPDFEVTPPPATERPTPGARLLAALRATGLFLAATFAIAVVLFAPVALTSLARIETLEVAGRVMTAAQFADTLGALFWGTFILAFALTSFIASLMLVSTGCTIRPRRQPLSREDALTHLAVLRMVGPER